MKLQLSSKKETRFDYNLKYFIYNAMFFTIMVNLYKPFLANYLKLLGGTADHISLMDSLPGLVAIFTIIPGTLLMNKLGSKQKTTALVTSISRAMLLLFACVPFLPDIYRPLLLAVSIGLRNFPESLSLAGTQSFTGEVFSPKERSKAITTSRSYGMLIQIAVAGATGLIMTYLPSNHEEKIMTYQVFFVVAFIMGMLEVYNFMKLDYTEPQVDKKAKKFNIKVIFDMEKSKKYWGFVLCSVIFHFGWQMGWSLFAIKQVQVLGATEAWRAAIFAASSMVGFFTYRMWHSFIDKHGSNKTAFITILGMASNSFFIGISPNLPVMITLATISGIFTSGTVTVLLNMLLEVTPEENRVVYVGVYQTILNISLCISPLVGLAIFRATDIFVALMAVTVLRSFGGLAFFIRYRIVKARAAANQNM